MVYHSQTQVVSFQPSLPNQQPHLPETMSLRAVARDLLLGTDSSSSNSPRPTSPIPPPAAHYPPPFSQPPHPPPFQLQQQQQQQPHPPPFQQQQQQPIPSIPWLLISETDIRSPQSNAPLFHITRSTAPGSLSSKSLVTLTRAATGMPLGTIRLRSGSDVIELENNGQPNRMKIDGMGVNFRWYFHPLAYPGLKWFWSGAGKGLKLTDGKNGPTLATLTEKTLVCENVGLTEAAVDEIVLTVVASLVKQKKLGKDAKAADGAAEIISAIAGG